MSNESITRTSGVTKISDVQRVQDFSSNIPSSGRSKIAAFLSLSRADKQIQEGRGVRFPVFFKRTHSAPWPAEATALSRSARQQASYARRPREKIGYVDGVCGGRVSRRGNSEGVYYRDKRV